MFLSLSVALIKVPNNLSVNVCDVIKGMTTDNTII